MTEAPTEDLEAVGLQLRACERHRDQLKDEIDEIGPRLVRALEEVESLKRALRTSEEQRDDWQAAVADLVETYSGKDAGIYLPGAMADARLLLKGDAPGLRTQIADLQAALDVAKIDFDAQKEAARAARAATSAVLKAKHGLEEELRKAGEVVKTILQDREKAIAAERGACAAAVEQAARSVEEARDAVSRDCSFAHWNEQCDRRNGLLEAAKIIRERGAK